MNKSQGQESEPALNHGDGLSYLLRAWVEKPTWKSVTGSWRYSLVDLRTKAQRGFGDLDSLMGYFRGIESEVDKQTSNITPADGDME